ncbi:MAG: hypothetical protein RJB39_457 [Candidatus Parcubacteria bacterium]|jgi:hypothetical protein
MYTEGRMYREHGAYNLLDNSQLLFKPYEYFFARLVFVFTDD